MSKADEAKVTKKIVEYINKLHDENNVPIKIFNRSGYTPVHGLPDKYAVLSGFHIEIEVKGIGGTPSPSQLNFEREIKDLGCLYIRPGSFEEFKVWIDALVEALKK